MILIRTQPSLNRDFALLSLFIVFLMVIMSSWVAYETYDDQRLRTEKKLAQAAIRIDTALTQEIKYASQLLDAMGKQIAAHPRNDYRAISDIFKSYQSYRIDNKSVFSWLNRDQKLAVSSDFGISETMLDVSDRDYAKRAISKPGRVVISRPIKGRTSKRWVVPMSLGIADENGAFIGALFLGLDIDSIQKTARAAASGKDIDFTITNRAFTVLTNTYARNSLFRRYFDLSELSKKDFLKPQSGLYASAKPWDSKTVFAYYQTSKKHPFVYFLTDSRAASILALKTILVARIFQLLAVGGFLLFVLWTVRKRIIQPVIALSDNTKAATLGSSFETVAYHGPQEIQSLNREIYKFWLYTQERKRIESELRNKLANLIRIKDTAALTNKIKADFFASVGEILQAPTQVILEQSETIKDQHFGAIASPKYLKNATEIHQHAKAMLNVLDDMLKISSSESGMIELHESWVDIPQLLRKTLELFNDTHGVSLQLQVDNHAPLPSIRGDKQRLRHLLMHLFTIVAMQSGKGDILRVSSNIRSSELRLFFSYNFASGADAASQSKNTLTTSMAFTLAKLIAAMHQGDFEVKTTPNKITTFTLKLPAARIASEKPNAPT
jgi:signal transduction histidine kinase/Tfp pilus assembly protein PilE